MSEAKGTIKSLLTSAVPVVKSSTTAYEAEQLLRARANEYETINYLYIVDDNNLLKGVLSIQELFHLEPNSNLESFVRSNLITVHADAEPSVVAELALRNTIKAIPVLDSAGVLLGVVPSDQIIKILSHEHTRDVLRLAGVTHKDTHAHDVLLNNSAWSHVKMRLPWLVLGLIGGMAAAAVVGFFEETLANELILAAFIPSIVYMADAVGAQTQMLFVRVLSIDANLKLRTYLFRETIVNGLLGLVLGLLIFAVSLVWIKSFVVSLILGLSIFLTVLFTVLVAIFLPWILFKRGQDPAVASGPLATVIRDILSLCIYLLVASVFLLS
jgi:magnesium transporter